MQLGAALMGDPAKEQEVEILLADLGGDLEVSAVIALMKRPLFAYFARRVSTLDDAADLCSEVFLALWRRCDDLPSTLEEARMWVYGVARRTLANYRRSEARRSKLHMRLRSEASVSGDNRPVNAELWDALSALHPVDREIVQLVHWDGLSLAEVASVLGKKAPTVRSRYARARATLKARLSGTIGSPN
jgi:RNA polymerase sigma-70 factor, ECF subfamily